MDDQIETEPVQPDVMDAHRMDINQFREEGWLQEVNRLWLHPVGMALAVEAGVTKEDVAERLAMNGYLYGEDAIDACMAVIRCWHLDEDHLADIYSAGDPDGWVFAWTTDAGAVDMAWSKAQRVAALRQERMNTRRERLGYILQDLPEVKTLLAVAELDALDQLLKATKPVEEPVVTDALKQLLTGTPRWTGSLESMPPLIPQQRTRFVLTLSHDGEVKLRIDTAFGGGDAAVEINLVDGREPLNQLLDDANRMPDPAFKGLYRLISAASDVVMVHDEPEEDYRDHKEMWDRLRSALADIAADIYQVRRQTELTQHTLRRNVAMRQLMGLGRELVTSGTLSMDHSIRMQQLLNAIQEADEQIGLSDA